jgi:hypothetical protein
MGTLQEHISAGDTAERPEQLFELTAQELEAAANGNPNVVHWVYSRVTNELGHSSLTGQAEVDAISARFDVARLSVARAVEPFEC